MRLPFAPNTMCDLYRGGTSPPANPTIANVACHLQSALPQALVACQNVDARQRFSHRLLLPLDVDVRDRYDAGSQATGDSDRVYIPDREGVAYRVVFVERRLRGTTLDHLRVYLSRVGTSASVEA